MRNYNMKQWKITSLCLCPFSKSAQKSRLLTFLVWGFVLVFQCFLENFLFMFFFSSEVAQHKPQFLPCPRPTCDKLCVWFVRWMNLVENSFRRRTIDKTILTFATGFFGSDFCATIAPYMLFWKAVPDHSRISNPRTDMSHMFGSGNSTSRA